MSSFTTEHEEIDHLISLATFPGVKAALNAHKRKLEATEKEAQQRAAAQQAEAEKKPVEVKPSSVPILPKLQYTPIADFAWDQGEYNSAYISIFIDLEGVGEAKDRVEAKFYENSFDVTVTDLKGKNYRLLKDNLEKNIVPDGCKCVVKSNKIVLKLQKIKGAHSYEHWTHLTAKKKVDPAAAKSKKDDPTAGQLTIVHNWSIQTFNALRPCLGLMDMMKDLYEDGDESMRKVIGEAMLKSHRGEKMERPSMNEF